MKKFKNTMFASPLLYQQFAKDPNSPKLRGKYKLGDADIKLYESPLLPLLLTTGETVIGYLFDDKGLPTIIKTKRKESK